MNKDGSMNCKPYEYKMKIVCIKIFYCAYDKINNYFNELFKISNKKYIHLKNIY